MFPLLCRDKLILPYIAVHGLFILLYCAPGGRQDTTNSHSSTPLKSFVIAFLVFCSLILHIVYLTIHPPQKYPYLFEAMIMLLCFSQFILISVYANTKQWMLSRHYAVMDKEKKQL
ncbi:unnamed protein product [Ilex paraguariensis]|uniref:Alpha-1,3-glucosyltransferase n=1 Tax=Ilex paraguariensis TaxID=185542 RepID=A0ABC8TEW4_9AQUA